MSSCATYWRYHWNEGCLLRGEEGTLGEVSKPAVCCVQVGKVGKEVAGMCVEAKKLVEGWIKEGRAPEPSEIDELYDILKEADSENLQTG